MASDTTKFRKGTKSLIRQALFQNIRLESHVNDDTGEFVVDWYGTEETVNQIWKIIHERLIQQGK